MWYSKSVDVKDRARIGRLYLKLRDTPDKVLDLGDSTQYPSAKPDIIKTFNDQGSSPSALGAIMGIYFTHSNTRSSGLPFSLNMIGFLIPDPVTKSAYTIDLPDIDEKMIQVGGFCMFPWFAR